MPSLSPSTPHRFTYDLGFGQTFFKTIDFNHYLFFDCKEVVSKFLKNFTASPSRNSINYYTHQPLLSNISQWLKRLLSAILSPDGTLILPTEGGFNKRLETACKLISLPHCKLKILSCSIEKR